MKGFTLQTEKEAEAGEEFGVLDLRPAHGDHPNTR